MPATRSQKAALASPLASTTTRKRSVSRAPSAEPPARKAPPRAASRKTSPVEGAAPAVITTTTTITTTTKRKQVAGDEQEETQESPKKRVRTLRDIEFRERLQKRVEEKKAAKELEQHEAPEVAAPVFTPKGPYSYLPTYPSPSQQPDPKFTFTPQTAPQSRQYSWWKPPSEAVQPPTTPAQMNAPTQQVAQTQPQQRGFIGRFIEAVTPWIRPAQTPSGRDMRLPDARIDLVQLQEHTKLQNRLNSELSQELARAEQRRSTMTPHHEYEAEQEQKQPGSKRKRTAANETTGLPPLNVISESPEARFTDNMQTPSRPRIFNGLVPKSAPRPRRTYKEARAAAANKGTRNAADPPTPAVSRTAPTTPYNKNDYARIRRLREIEELGAQHNAMKAKLDKLRAEQEAEAAAQPRKTKRVKIEHLKEIPHNLPGESSGSFRFPEADSDDEIEVDEDVEVIENPFTATDDDMPESRQVSPAKTPASNPFTAQPSKTMFETPALKASSPVKRAVSPVRKAPSPVKKMPSLIKKAPSPVKEIEEVVEIEDSAVDARNSSSPASPEPTQVFSDESEEESDIEDEDWPELPQRKEGEPEPPQWWKDQALAKFNKEFAHWEATGEIMA
jgi:hypothetical protein